MNTNFTNTAATSTTSPQSSAEINGLMRRAMADSDNWVIEMEYADSKGVQTQRTISPIRFVGSDRILALCLCREEPRQFYVTRCQSVRLKRSSDVLMPLMIG